MHLSLWHTCGIFVYRLATAIDISKVRFPIFVTSMKLMKSVES